MPDVVVVGGGGGGGGGGGSQKKDSALSSAGAAAKPGSLRRPMLAVWGLVGLHRLTGEYSAQGLSRSLGAAVERAEGCGQRLVLGEEEAGSVDGGGVGGGGGDPWREQVPLLSGSVRFGGEDRVWAGKTVEVKRVVGRWCRFVRVGDGG